jgi:hypothetical protein
MASRLPTGGGPHPSNLPAPLHRPPKPAAEPSSRRKTTMTAPKPPSGQAVVLVTATDTHPERRGTTPLQRSTMPAPSRGWKPPSTTPGPSSRRRKTMMGPKPPGGQAAAPVAVANAHPECRSGHPPNVNPCQSTTTSGSSSRWKPKATDPKPLDGEAAAPDADAGLPPNGQLHPALRDDQTRGGKVQEVDLP